MLSVGLLATLQQMFVFLNGDDDLDKLKSLRNTI